MQTGIKGRGSKQNQFCLCNSQGQELEMIPLKQYPWLNVRGMSSQTMKFLISLLIFKLSCGKSNFDYLWPLVQIHKIYHTLIFFNIDEAFVYWSKSVQKFDAMKTFDRCLYLCCLPNLRDFHGKLQCAMSQGWNFLLNDFITLSIMKNIPPPKKLVCYLLFSSKRVPLSNNRKGYHVVIMEILKILSARYIFFYSLKNT